MKARRSLTLGVFPALLMVATVVPFALFWGDLPDPMATHWGLSGAPDGSMPPVVLLIAMTTILGGVWFATAAAARRTPVEAASFTAVLWFVGTLLATVTWMSVLAGRDAASWQDAGELGLLQVVMAIGGATAAGAAGWLLAGRRSTSAVTVPGPTLPLEAGHQVVWTGQRTSWQLAIVGFGLIVAGVVVWGVTSMILAIIGLLVLVFAKVTVTTGSGGVVVAMGWLGFPSWRVPIGEITGADTEDVRPLAYGGWGYRFRPGARAIVVSGGEGLRIHRDGKAALVITVDDATTGAGAVNAAVSAVTR